ncbi:hypothetical protein AcV7_009514 [Taiwanofungus camphoratus]|nr:hypothetical protein AcV7_009514 [Antrodia cinnamomea]
MANKKEPHYQAHRMHSRSRASSVLWGHLLSRDASTPSLTPRVQSDVTSLSPITPLDKAGTSMRILLHDTQAHLEKFSDRVTKLINGVDESKREIVTVQKLFEQDREKLVEETVDLVNRCQTEIQRTVGAPAQASKIDELQADLVAVDSKLHALDKKMDLLHMLNQTQTQALQTLQDQQGKMLTALTPILPLLQAVPLHIDNARNRVEEVLRGKQYPPLAQMSPLGVREARSKKILRGTLSDLSVDSSSLSPEEYMPERKKRRLDAETVELRCRTIHKPAPNDMIRVTSVHPFSTDHSQLLASESRVQPVLCPSLPPSFDKQTQDADLHFRNVNSRHNVYSTPRRMPLADLLPPNDYNHSPSTLAGSAVEMTKIGSIGSKFTTPVRSTPSESKRNPSNITNIGNTASRLNATTKSPSTPRKMASLTSSTSTFSQGTSMQPVSLSGPLVPDLRSIPGLQKVIAAADTSPLSSCRSDSPANGNSRIPISRSMTSVVQLYPISSDEMHTDHGASHTRNNPHATSIVCPTSQDGTMTAPLTRSHPVTLHNRDDGSVSGTGKTMSLKDRRAQLPTPSLVSPTRPSKSSPSRLYTYSSAIFTASTAQRGQAIHTPRRRRGRRIVDQIMAVIYTRRLVFASRPSDFILNAVSRTSI